MMRTTANRLEDHVRELDDMIWELKRELGELNNRTWELKRELGELKSMEFPKLVKDYIDVIVREKLVCVMVKRDVEQIVGMFKGKLDGKFDDDAFDKASEEIIRALSKEEE